MNTAQPSAASVALSAASLGHTHGYRVDGDVAILNAEIIRCRDEAANCNWRMQLWACPAPFTGGHIQGIRVADVPVENIAGAPTHVTASGLATPPAGSQYHTMVMVLASQEAGRFATIHDYANYPLPQSFTLPRMLGNVGYRFDDKVVRIDIEAVENPREAANISGTLAIQLWALEQPYSGGEFTGAQLADINLGTLTGQGTERNLSFVLPLKHFAGTAHLVLMLREWTAAGFITRDYACFVEPVQRNAAVVVNQADTHAARTPAESRAMKSTKVLSAMLGSVTTAARNRANVAANHARNDATAAVATSVSKEEVLRNRGRGRKLLARLTAVTKAGSRR